MNLTPEQLSKRRTVYRRLRTWAVDPATTEAYWWYERLGDAPPRVSLYEILPRVTWRREYLP